MTSLSTKYQRLFNLAILIGLIFPFIAQSQIIVMDNLEIRLTKKGFDNVVVLKKDSQLIISYENRIYQNEVKAISKILEEVKSKIIKTSKVILMPTSFQAPIVAINIESENYLTLQANQMAKWKFSHLVNPTLKIDKENWNAIQSIGKRRERSFSLDIVIHPQLITRLGQFDDPFKAQFNLVPEVSLSLWKGMRLSAQTIFPLKNELHTEEGDQIRPGIITLSQSFRFPKDIFGSFSAGYFTRHRYGLDGNIRKYLLNGHLSVGINMGYTGYAIFWEGSWHTKKLDKVTGLFDIGYQIPKYNLMLKGSYGKFLYDDKGCRFDIHRQFKNTGIGFFGIYTEKGKNIGFTFSMNLFSAKFFQTKWLRLRPSKVFSWTYRYSRRNFGGYQYKQEFTPYPFYSQGNPVNFFNQFSN